MSFIDSEARENCYTDATMNDLECALKSFGYDVQRTRLQITAKHGGYWSTNGHLSTITIVDRGDVRYCEDIETSKGYMCMPDSGILAKIVECAETKSFEKKTDDGRKELVKHENPTSKKQTSVIACIIGGLIAFLLIYAIIMMSIL